MRDGTRVELRRRLAAREGARVNGEPRGALGGAGAAASAGAARLAVTHVRQVTVARLAGEVDLEATAGLREELAAAVPKGDRGLVVDLTRVGYLDSAGLHLLHDTARTLAARGQSLRVVFAAACGHRAAASRSSAWNRPCRSTPRSTRRSTRSRRATCCDERQTGRVRRGAG